MIKAVLFDLDDTLLDINLSAFVARYALGKAKILSRIARVPTSLTFSRIARSYMAVCSESRTDGLTNAELYNQSFERLSGIPIEDPVIADAIDYYESECLWDLKGGPVLAREREGARATIERAQSLGLTVALATNPTFSLACDKVRMEWAGVADVDFARISHIENSHRVKPDAAYYEEFVGAIGLEPHECLMVGNDARRDFPRPDIELRTAYVGHGWPKRAIWRGPIGTLGSALPQILEILNTQDEKSEHSH